jgi:hypothetical protein
MHLKRTITYTTILFLSCFFTSWSKTLSGITTSVGDSTTITICDGDSVTFTLDRVSGIAEGYEFNVNPYERNFLPHHSFLFTYGSLTKYDTSYYLFLSQELQLGEFSLGISQ